MIVQSRANMMRNRICLRGLNPDKIYILEGSGKSFTGKALIDGGILLPKVWGDYCPVEMHFKEEKHL